MKLLNHLGGLLMCFSALSLSAQNSRLFLAGGAANEKFNTIFQLSDSTLLVAGEAENFNWIPASTPVVILDTIAGQAPVTPNASSFGFLLHMTKDMGQVVRAFRLPPNTLESINKIKTNTKPGQPTGDLYFSGRRGVNQGYFIGRLDKNFLNGIPAKVEMGILISSGIVSTGGKHDYDGPSYHRLFQPWDVDGDGKILAATGEEFEFDWASVEKYRRNGTRDSVEYFPRHLVRLDGGTEWPAVTGRAAEINTRRASDPLPDSLWVRVIDNPSPTPDVFDSVHVSGLVGSDIVLKSYRAGGMRSQTQTEFDLLQTDENGNPGRKHARTDDFLYASFCAIGNCQNEGPGYLGYNPTEIWNARVGDIALNRENGDMYVTYTIPTQGPTVQSPPLGKARPYDMQPVLVAFEANGQIKWWARLMKEAFGGNPADQLTDGLAIDYSTNSLVVLGHVFDTCTHNYWKGNELALNQQGNGFQNQHTGSDPKIEYSWLGKFDLVTGKIRYATYVAEQAKITPAGTPLAGPEYDGWANPNTGNPRLAETMVPVGSRTLEVDAAGRIYLIARTQGRAITTGNAYQKMPKPSVQNIADSLPPGETQFLRIYKPDLSGLIYSTIIAGIWNPQDSVTRSPVSLNAVCPTGNGFYLAGFHSGKNQPNESIPVGTLNPPTWANDSMRLNSGLLALHVFGQTGFIAKPSPIVGPASHCPGETKTYSIAPVTGASSYQWVMPGANWQIVGPADGPTIQVKFTGSLGGQMRVVAKNANGISEPSFLNIPNSQAPPTVNTSGFVCPSGGTVTLTALGSTPGNYRWYPDSTTTFPIADEVNGTYLVTSITQTTRFFVSILAANGCETERRGVNARYGKAAPGINPLPAAGPPYTALQSIPSVLPQGVSRTWQKNGAPAGTGAVIGLSGEGTYRLCFTNSCGDSCVTYVVTGIRDLVSDAEIRVYPNPTAGNLTIEWINGPELGWTATVVDVLGKRQLQQALIPAPTGNVVSLPTSALGSGVYLLRLEGPKGTRVVRWTRL